MLITKEMLENKNACKPQYDIFVKEWPNGAIINEDNLKKAVTLNLDLNWFIYNFLPHKYREAYKAAERPLWEDYEAARIPLWEAYEAARLPLWEAYEAAARPLWEACEAAARPLWEACEAAARPLWEAYEAAKRPLWEAYEAARLRLWEAYEAAERHLQIEIILDYAKEFDSNLKGITNVNN